MALSLKHMALPHPWVQRASRYNDQNHYIEGVPWNLHKPPFNFPPPLETLSEDGPGKTHKLAKYLSVRVCTRALRRTHALAHARTRARKRVATGMSAQVRKLPRLL
jgi:hypothetical protein